MNVCRWVYCVILIARIVFDINLCSIPHCIKPNRHIEYFSIYILLQKANAAGSIGVPPPAPLSNLQKKIVSTEAPALSRSLRIGQL